MNHGKTLITAVALLSLGMFSYHANAQEAGDISSESATSATSEHVARAVFTSGVQDREPTDALANLSNDKNQIYFFSELRGLGGQTVTHRWEYQGKVMSEVKFNVGGPRWRVWSNKTLLPQLTGEWRVSVVDGEGNSLATASFNYTSAEPANQGM